jgi:hypothetical protein
VALPNRVDPWGRIVAVPERGTMMGNRGGALHDASRRIVREQKSRRWIICRLEFNDRRRNVMAPGQYTELFFLDEATALAAGHRPCFECRRPDFTRYRDLFRTTTGDTEAAADDMDRVLAAERRATGPEVRVADLPRGAFVEVDGHAWVVDDGQRHRWSPGGYDATAHIPADERARLLTPPTTVAVVRAGYDVTIHPTAIG